MLQLTQEAAPRHASQPCRQATVHQRRELLQLRGQPGAACRVTQHSHGLGEQAPLLRQVLRARACAVRRVRLVVRVQEDIPKDAPLLFFTGVDGGVRVVQLLQRA